MEEKTLVGDDRWELANRVADTPQFRRSPRLREFLLYACDRALRGQHDELHEQQIGCKVFGRRPGYNPSEDNIVRVEARKLRTRLEEYFASEGRVEPVLIAVPKGSYVPNFVPRPVASTGAALPRETALPVPPLVTARPGKGRWVWVQPALIFLLALTCLWLSTRGFVRRPLPRSSPTPALGDLFWSMLFNDQQDTKIVCADSTLVLLERFLRRPIPLSDYVSQSYLSTLLGVKRRDGSPLFLADKQYTSMANVHLVEKMLLLNHARWGRTSVRSARNMELSDFKSGNFVLIGSRRAIPWVELFEPRVNFRYEYDEALQIGLFVNKSPQPGEESKYIDSIAGKPGKGYSSVLVLPNLSSTGYALIVNGTTGDATEAAGEYLINPVFCSTLLKTVGFHPGSKPGSFEVLLKSSTLAGTSRDSEIAAYRAWRDE